MKLISYILCVFVLVIIVVISCHVTNLKKNNNKIELLKVEDPSINKIQELLQEKSPIIFLNVLYKWEPIVNNFDKSLISIQNKCLNDKTFHSDLKDCFNSYSLFGSMGWDYYFIDKTILDTDEYFSFQNQHRHIICQVTGVQRYYLASPNQSKFINSKKWSDSMIKENIYKNFESEDITENKVGNNYISILKNNLVDISKKNPTKSTINFWNEQETGTSPFNETQYIEIILREGNVLHIPYGWWYLSQIEEDGSVVEAFNISVLSMFV